MTKKTLLALTISAALVPAFYVSAAETDTTSGATEAAAAQDSSTATKGVRFRSGPQRHARGVAFGRGHSGHSINVSHASSAIANIPMDATTSSITLFGELDAGIKLHKTKGKSATVELTSGNWYWTSWGIKGVEDIGNGNAVIFTLQQAFRLNNGESIATNHSTSSSGGFNNQAFLGLQGHWGRLTFGRQGGLSSGDGDYSMLGGSAIGTGMSVIGDLQGVFYLTGWQNNSIAYRTQEWNGLQFTAMYSNGVSSDTDKWSKKSHYYGLGMTYDVGNFNSNLMYEMEDHKGNTTKIDKTNIITAGASYDFGSFTLYGAYQYTQHATRMPNYNQFPVNASSGASTSASATSGASAASSYTKGANQNAASISVATPLWGGNLMLQLNGVKGKIKDDGTKYSAWSVGSAYTYPLSKRTLLYGGVAYGNAYKALDGSDLDGYTAVVGMATSF